MDEAGLERPLFSDVRRYYCEFCGICRSKKSLIASHIVAHHKEEIEVARAENDKEPNTCKQCGATFKKLAYLKQHMQSHSLECEALDPTPRTPKCSGYNLIWTSIRLGDLLRSSVKWTRSRCFRLRPYTCSIDGCQASYRRKDHLTRHLLSHKQNQFKCLVENCSREFVTRNDMNRHIEEQHDENQASSDECQRRCVCQEPGCGKAFKYPSKLQKHEDSHVKLDSIEALCAEPGCMKIFSNSKCLKEHVQSCHQHTTCDVCGTKQLRKNIKRHIRTHEGRDLPMERLKCNFKDCDCTFSTKSNLMQHVKAVHFEDKPFVCGVSGCGMRFSYKHVRDKHENIGFHVYARGDFVELDEQFQSRPRGGRKRTYPSVEMLIRKRVVPPNLMDGFPYLN